MTTVDTVTDVIKGLNDFLISEIDLLTTDNCMIGYPFDAIEDLGDIGDVSARVSVYDLAAAPDLDYAAPSDEEFDLEADPPVVTLTRTPLPFRVFFQISIWTRRLEDSHTLLGTLAALFHSRLEFQSRSGSDYDLFLEETASMDEFTDRGSSKVVRVSVPLWLPDAHDPETIAIVTTILLEINNQTITIENEQE